MFLNRKTSIVACLAVIFAAGVFIARQGTAQLATTLLPNAWQVSDPSGAEKTLGTLPQGMVLSPDGNKVALLESGVAPPFLRVFDAHTLTDRASVELTGAWGRPCWDTDGYGIWVGTGDDNTLVHVDLSIPDHAKIDRTVAIASPKVSWYPGYIARDPHSGLLAVSGESAGAIAIVDPVKGRVVGMITIDASNAQLASHPAQLVWNADGSRIYVALWGLSGIAILDPQRFKVIERVRTAFHPEALALSADGKSLYVANADDDSISVIATANNTVEQTVRLRLFAQPQLGLQPNDVFIDDANNRLYVSLADANAIAVLSTYPMKFLGAIPTGWYPTGSVVAGNMLLVADGKGESSHANPDYNPYAKPPPKGKYDHSVASTTRPEGYIGYNLIGSLRQVAIPSDADLSALTAQVQKNAGPMLASGARPARPLDQDEIDGAQVIRPNGPIHHVIYIIKENRTYDQVLGDDPNGDGDPGLAIFGKQITPNEHAIADRFGLFDRTFTDSHVSEDGHQWITEAFGNDYVEKTWPPEYAGRRNEDDSDPYVTETGYIWDVAQRAHITYRTYGEFAMDDPHHKGRYIGSLPSLIGHTAPYFPPFNLAISDQVRLAAWEKEFWVFIAHDNLPQLETLWLMNDHTMGTRVGARTPQAYVADNDLAIGRIVQDVSHSRYWKDTAIFIIEDDAQNGPDHVDDQRTTMYIASPYARGGLQHHHYTQTGLLRTIELILGLPAMTTYDAAAEPLYAAFTSQPNFAPYDALQEAYPINTLNAATAYGAAISAKLDFTHADAANPAILNNILMHAVSVAKAEK